MQLLQSRFTPIAGETVQELDAEDLINIKKLANKGLPLYFHVQPAHRVPGPLLHVAE